MKNEKGLTLAEATIALGIASVVGVLLLAIIVNSAGLFYKESSKVSQGLDINDTLAKVREVIKEASGISSSYQDGSTTYTSSATQLVLKVPSVDSSSNIIANTYDYYVFFQDTNKLRLKVFPNALSSRKVVDQIFSTNLNYLLFQYLNSANPPSEVTPASAVKVRITLTLKQKAGTGTEQNTATSEANLRND